jgi:hypothetical protein
MSDVLTAAIRCAALGWPVFPCNGKRPLTSNGLHDATVDEGAIRAWWALNPEAKDEGGK